VVESVHVYGAVLPQVHAGKLVVADAATAGEIVLAAGGEAHVQAPLAVISSFSSPSTDGTFSIASGATAELTGGSNVSYAHLWDLAGTLTLDADSELDVDNFHVSSGSSGTVNGGNTSVLAIDGAIVEGTVTFNLASVASVGVGG